MAKTNYEPEAFDKGRTVYARKPFQSNGRLLLPGQVYDWKHQSVAIRRVAQLFRARYLTHLTPDDVEVVEEKELESSKESYSLKQFGVGWWNIVDSDGNKKLDKNVRKTEAEKEFQLLSE